MAISKTPNEKSTYPSISALADELHMCEKSVREALRENKIPHIRLGKRYILPRAAIQEWLRTAGAGGKVAA